MLHRLFAVRTPLACAALVLAASSPAQAVQSIDPSGAYASGYASGDFMIGCTTCPHYMLTLSGDPAPQAGGPGQATASVSYTGVPLRDGIPDGYTVGGMAALAAQASLVGVMATPLLRAQAFADNAPVFDHSLPPVEIGIDLYQVSATANTIQAYTYIGTGSATYTFSFHLDGIVSSELASFGGHARFTDVYGELSYAANGLDFSGVGLVPDPRSFSGNFDVSMTFNAGETFYLNSSLTALASATYSSADVNSDAFNTMFVTGITGNTALLVPGIPGVPEPATWAAMLAGLAALGVWRRASLG